MMKLNRNAVVYSSDGTDIPQAAARTTHLAVAAHQDDIEFMAYSPIAECFQKPDLWFSGVVVGDGAGSPRSGAYAAYSDEEMKAVRALEQKKAAHVGGYSMQILLGHPSEQIKDAGDGEIESELYEILRAAKPKYVYIHNLADKHRTHVAAALKTIAALRRLKKEERPFKVYGCEVWRDLDWLCDADKVCLDCGGHPNLARALSGVFDSQIAGGKRYDLAAEGRRMANATFSESHACDAYTALNYAMDLTPLMEKETDIAEYLAGYIRRFEREVLGAVAEYTEEKKGGI